MNVTHKRPGVYSAYEVSSVSTGRTGGKTVAVLAECTKGTAGELYPITDGSQAVALFGAEEKLTKLTDLALRNGAGKVIAVPVSGKDGYKNALATISATEDIQVVTSDATDPTVKQNLKGSVLTASRERRERVGVIFGDETQPAAQLCDFGESFNNERVIILANGGAEGAAAVAGAIAGESDPALPLSGVELKGLTSLSKKWTESDLDALIEGGILPLEERGGAVSIVRAVTCKTRVGTGKDATWRDLSSILVVDDVVPHIRRTLQAKFRRAKNTPQSRGAIRSQVIVELENKLRQEIITAYDGVKVSALDSDPSVCLVEFHFAVAHGLNQIWLSASVTI